MMLVTVYCFVDEFVNMILQQPIAKEIMKFWDGKRGPKKGMSLAEVIALALLSENE
jgi:hypothetical protein